jgi:hypothetical protein
MPIYSTTRSKTSPDRSKILVCVFTLISSFGQQVGYAYWAPLRDVNAWIDGMRVHFSVYDPVREQEMVGSGPWTNQDPTNVIVNDGVVAWLQGTNPYFTVYDPIRGYWQTGHELNVTTTVNLLTNEDGVVAYIRENTNVNLLIFDPATGPSGYWVKANGSFSNIALSEFRN